MHMVIRVAVAGASGYVGGEVLRVFSGHPDVEFGALTLPRRHEVIDLVRRDFAVRGHGGGSTHPLILGAIARRQSI